MPTKSLPVLIKKGLLLTLLSVFLLSFSFLALNPKKAEAKCYYYVSQKGSGSGNGSLSNPYNKIKDALTQAEKNNACKNVYLLSGTYKENELYIPEEVEVFGEGRDRVFINGDNKDKDVIIMKHKAKVQDFTIENGKNGIRVKEDAKAYIWNMRIRKNDRDGIKIEKAEVKEKRVIDIANSIIEENGWNGIYSEERYFYMEDNVISKNEKDGIEFKAGSKGTIKDNVYRKNEGVGMKLTLDESEIYIKDSSFKDNEKSGLEVKSKDEEGKITILKKSKFYDNDKYGIIRLNNGTLSTKTLNDSFIIEKNTQFSGNNKGAVSNWMNIK